MFAFCRYIKVSNSKTLIDSLSNVWIGKLRLHANVARFDRNATVKPPHVGEKVVNDVQPNKAHGGSAKNLDVTNTSFVSVLNAGRRNTNAAAEVHPTIVLNEECYMERDFSCSLMGKIKDINALPNLYLILSNEGFENVNVTHLGGLWVLLDMGSKEKIHKHVGIGSWFTELKPACNSFVSDEIITWISIEGLPITAMTRNTCASIVSSWGEIIDVDEPESTTLSYKKLCVKVKSHVTISVKEYDSSSEGEIDGEDKVHNSDSELDIDNEVDHAASDKSDDPFGIYKILKRNNDKVASESVDPQFPPGFTPVVAEVNVTEDADPNQVPHPKIDVTNNNKDVSNATGGYNGVLKLKSGGSLLDVMDELIKVGQTMGYNMEGCMHNI
ncbi:hypothetical protein Tco_0154098 [Tanacetum coccineum]